MAIEIDGGVHGKSFVKEYDKYRQQYLEALGVTVIRFKNEEVVNNMSKVLESIKFNLDN